LINLTASYKTDRYMGGVIKANQREKCSGCGSAFKNVKLPEFENTVPFCTPCKKYPRLFRIRITLPGSPKKDVRYNFEGRRLTKPSLADAALIRIRDEIRNGTFDSLKYISKKNKSGLLLKNFINFYIDTRENLTPAARKSMLSLDKNYLSPFFGETYLSDITSGLIKSFEIQWKPVGNAKTTRQRDKCLELLKSILKLAKELEYIKFIPNFPKIAKTKRKKHVIDFETQEKIINNIPTHLRAAFKLMQLYMIRPCEVRALRGSTP